MAKETPKCIVCEREFAPWHPLQKTCSMTCRKQYDRDQRADYREKYKLRHAERMAQYKKTSNYSLAPATAPIKRMCEECGSRYLLCPNCGKTITNPDRNQIFCCRQCVVENRRKHRRPPQPPKIAVNTPQPKVEPPKVKPTSKYKNNLNVLVDQICIVCQKKFEAKRTNQKVCGEACRHALNLHNSKAYNARMKAQKENNKSLKKDNITKNIIGKIKL